MSHFEIVCNHCKKYRKEAKRFKRKYLALKIFAEWLAKELMDDMYEDNYLAIAEVARRKLFNLGFLDEENGYWVPKEENKDETDN